MSPGSAVTGFPPGIVTGGTIHVADAVAAQAQSDLTVAYNNLASQPCTADLTGQDLGGKTLTPGVYCFSSSAQLTGTLTLDAQGNAGAVFVFKIDSTLTTASNATVQVINGGSLCNVFFQVGSSATLGTGTSFQGNILALTSITANTGVNVMGRLLARNGAVTLDTNTVSRAACGAAVSTSTVSATSTSTAIPAATQTAITAATATAIPAATQTAITAATSTAITMLPAATQTAITAATSTAITMLPAATQTAITAATATAIVPLPGTLSTSTGQIPSQLPNTGAGYASSSSRVGFLVSVLLLGGLGVLRARACLSRP